LGNVVCFEEGYKVVNLLLKRLSEETCGTLEKDEISKGAIVIREGIVN